MKKKEFDEALKDLTPLYHSMGSQAEILLPKCPKLWQRIKERLPKEISGTRGEFVNSLEENGWQKVVSCDEADTFAKRV